MESTSLRLELIQKSHASVLFRLFWDPLLYQYIPSDPPNLKALQERCERWEKQKSPDGKEIWLNWVAYSLDSEEVVGHFQITLKETGIAMIAYMVAKIRQRKGYASEGLLKIFEYLATNYKVKILHSFVDSRNIASMKLMENLGFVKKQFIENADFFKGAQSDEWLYEKQ